jgi:hypothetical protein
MTDDIFSERRRALEETFFARKNAELLEQLRKKYSQSIEREQLASLSGIHEEAVIDNLLTLGIHPETFAALSIVPLVLLAWSDDFVDPKESHQILKAAEMEGIVPGEPAFELLQGWLNERPNPRLFEDWRAYIQALKSRETPERISELRKHVLGRARRVARAAGGAFGFNKVAAAEQALLDKMEAAFA